MNAQAGVSQPLTSEPRVEQPTGDVSDQVPAKRTRLGVLAMGTDDWATEQVATALIRSGHTVLRCHEPGEAAFPCNALIEGRRCPLDEGFDVAITTRARSLPGPTTGEFGVVCALRQGVPLVVAGVPGIAPFQMWTSVAVEPGGDVVSACEKAYEDNQAALVDLRETQ
jgi:hypothetical protein